MKSKTRISTIIAASVGILIFQLCAAASRPPEAQLTRAEVGGICENCANGGSSCTKGGNPVEGRACNPQGAKLNTCVFVQGVTKLQAATGANTTPASQDCAQATWYTCTFTPAVNGLIWVDSGPAKCGKQSLCQAGDPVACTPKPTPRPGE